MEYYIKTIYNDNEDFAKQSIVLYLITFLSNVLISFFKETCKNSNKELCNNSVDCPINIESILLLDSSVPGKKISFHLHWLLTKTHSTLETMDNRHKSIVCFKNMNQAKIFARDFLEPSIASHMTDLTDKTISLEFYFHILKLLDLSVYTNWRCFRLPLCSKMTKDTENGPSLELYKNMSVNNIKSNDILASCHRNIPIDLLNKINCTPLTSFDTNIDTYQINCTNQLKDNTKADDLFDLSLITIPLNTPFNVLYPCNKKIEKYSQISINNELLLEDHSNSYISKLNNDLNTLLVLPTQSSLTLSFNSASSSVRYPVRSELLHYIIAIFNAIHPNFKNIHRIRSEYEDNGLVRGYYVYQKESKYCLNEHRYHQQTYGQLYITFSSIKFRCFSNDCYNKPCPKINWEALHFTDNYKNDTKDYNYSIKDILFPPLSNEELVKRYSKYENSIYE